MNDQEKRNAHNRVVLREMKAFKAQRQRKLDKSPTKTNDAAILEPKTNLTLKDGNIIESGIVNKQDEGAKVLQFNKKRQ